MFFSVSLKMGVRSEKSTHNKFYQQIKSTCTYKTVIAVRYFYEFFFVNRQTTTYRRRILTYNSGHF